MLHCKLVFLDWIPPPQPFLDQMADLFQVFLQTIQVELAVVILLALGTEQTGSKHSWPLLTLQHQHKALFRALPLLVEVLTCLVTKVQSLGSTVLWTFNLRALHSLQIQAKRLDWTAHLCWTHRMWMEFQPPTCFWLGRMDPPHRHPTSPSAVATGRVRLASSSQACLMAPSRLLLTQKTASVIQPPFRAEHGH